jgi:arginyl-tRNA synthetase
MAKIYLLIPLIFLAGFGCQDQSEQTAQTVSKEFFNSGPQLVKIPIKDSAVSDSLISYGMDVVVVEEDYIIARLSGQDAVRVQKMSLKMETFKEEELVQRLIKVVMKKKSDLQELSNTGIDIWEVKEDTVLAQAYDKYIRQIQEKGYAVEIVEKNILNVVKELNQK